ncbi:protein TIC236, chloroplastic-like isoform X2 [Humulus lupulus]|uniref:protein TIC236, chloroplastic-like isoform X2 n=1 Tax=Humulus lupulus TaxID=3486 RepID=UPI002B40DD41|nr:protein TIC236, chloroplastic-like isoform X2 [Humulus lupulus]
MLCRASYEEFSCGEVPTMKIRLRPFASLRRGKIVVDVVLSHPSILVVQKKDFSWLGLPSTGDGSNRHLSTEEGIDYPTKTRRIVREEASSRWERERDETAMKAAERGYIVTDKESSQYGGDVMKESGSQSIAFTSLESFLCMDERMHLRGHHCLDTGVDYDMKHADLEKSFGVKVPGSGVKFWSKVIQGLKRHKFNKKANGSDLSASTITAKRRILGHSAIAAAAYFQGLLHGKSSESSESSGGYDVTNLDTFSVKNEIDANAGTPITSVAGSNADCYMKSENVGGDVVNGSTNDEKFENQENLSTSIQLDTQLEANRPTFIWPQSLKSSFPTFSRNLKELLSCLFSGPIQKLTSDMGPRVELIVAELVDGVDTVHDAGIEKMLPVTLDSVYFKGGTLMLLAYGDMEPREMENVSGHVKFQNHYGQVHVQLSGNCMMWRSDLMCEDGGWLSADVFVDIVEEKWHANLKIANLFAPLFERILEIPIEWSKGRATGKVKARASWTNPEWEACGVECT